MKVPIEKNKNKNKLGINFFFILILKTKDFNKLSYTLWQSLSKKEAEERLTEVISYL